MKYACLGYIEDKYFADLTPKQQQEFMDACFAYDEELQKGDHMIKGKRATRMLTGVRTKLRPVYSLRSDWTRDRAGKAYKAAPGTEQSDEKVACETRAWLRQTSTRLVEKSVMKKPEREFVVEIDQKAHIGVSPESMLTIKLINSRTGRRHVSPVT
jgi:hypothetical protein